MESKEVQDRLDHMYARLPMMAQNISWREHKTKEQIYRLCRMLYVGDFPNRGQRPLNYINIIGRDIQRKIEDLPKLMKDRDSCQGVVNCISVAATI